jgi:hypothetical protein
LQNRSKDTTIVVTFSLMGTGTFSGFALVPDARATHRRAASTSWRPRAARGTSSRAGCSMPPGCRARRARSRRSSRPRAAPTPRRPATWSWCVAATRVALICLDDDNQGRRTEVLWELELGARVLSERDHGLGAAGGLAALWGAIEQEADAEADRAKKMLAHRARVESDAMRELLVAQERSIRTELAQHRAQLPLELTDPRERAAWLADTQAMTDRLPVARQARQARQARPRRPRLAPLTGRSIRPDPSGPRAA